MNSKVPKVFDYIIAVIYLAFGLASAILTIFALVTGRGLKVYVLLGILAMSFLFAAWVLFRSINWGIDIALGCAGVLHIISFLLITEKDTRLEDPIFILVIVVFIILIYAVWRRRIKNFLDFFKRIK